MLTAICILFLMCPAAFAAEHAEENTISTTNEEYRDTIILTEEDEIRVYLESLGEEYDPILVAVYRTVRGSNDTNYTVSPAIFVRDYYLKNQSTRTYTNTSVLLAQYLRPAGKVSISETITTSTTYSIDAGIDIEVLSAMLGVSLSETYTFNIDWEQTYSYPVSICVYPVYQEFTGEVWDKDAIFDDKIGNYTINRVVGDDIRVYKTAQV